MIGGQRAIFHELFSTSFFPRTSLPRTSGTPKTDTPFATLEPAAGRTVGLWMLLVSMVVFAMISLLLMFAARVPAVANSINDLLGVSRPIDNGQPDRSTHLFMLLFCYTSPLMLMLWVSLLRTLVRRRARHRQAAELAGDSNPFS